MNASKRITQVVGVALIVQLLAMEVFENIWCVIGPPLAVALPVALLTMRSPEMVQKMRPSDFAKLYVGVAIVGSAVLASFAWSGDDLSWDHQLLRMWFADLAILCFASTLGAQVATMRQPS